MRKCSACVGTVVVPDELCILLAWLSTFPYCNMVQYDD